jgi:hypothetical protein
MAEASQGDVVLTLAVGRGRRSRHTFDPTISIPTISILTISILTNSILTNSILTNSILTMPYTEGSLTDDPPPG